jgi:diaminopimelate epimerase
MILYEVLGNRFLVVEAKIGTFPFHIQKEVATWCDYGKKADGLLAVDVDRGRALVFNADGSYGQFSGNGARCVALYMWQRMGKLTPLNVTVGDSAVQCVPQVFGKDLVEVTVTISPARFMGQQKVVIGDVVYKGWRVDVGNPHWIVLQPSESACLRTCGAQLERATNSNIEYVWPIIGAPLAFRVLVYERGVGMTSACGSGAAAVAALLCEQGICSYERRIVLHMPGGTMECVVNLDRSLSVTAPVIMVK